MPSMSLKFSVTASTRICTSPGPGVGSSTSSRCRTSRGAPCSTARQARTGRSGDGLEREREVGEPPHVARVGAHHRLADLVVRVAREQLLEGDARLEPGERGADAQVDPEPEADVAFDLAVDVEVLGIREGTLVVVGRAG